jgi:hypothetical protein
MASSMTIRFCVIPDPIFPDGTHDDVAAFFSPDDPELPRVLASTGIESAPVFETSVPFGRLRELGFPEDARRTGDRVCAAPGYDVEPESEPFGT